MKADRRRRPAAPRNCQRGVTLLELLVVIVIIGVLSAIAIPSYTRYVIRTNRTAAKTTLMQVADREEQYFSNNKQYAAGLAALGFAADTIMVSREGNMVADADTSRVYRISLTGATATTFTASAVPQLRQAREDTACGTLTLTHTGVRGASGGADNCW